LCLDTLELGVSNGFAARDAVLALLGHPRLLLLRAPSLLALDVARLLAIEPRTLLALRTELLRGRAAMTVAMTTSAAELRHCDTAGVTMAMSAPTPCGLGHRAAVTLALSATTRHKRG
jgi:hypothetical protein